MSKESLRGLFTIIKGQYSKRGYSVICSDGEERYIGGYDPTDDNTVEWYRVLDKERGHCVCAVGDFNTALRCLRGMITHYRTRERFYKEQERCGSHISPPTLALHQEVIKHYGYFYSDIIEEIEDEAYSVLRDQRPFRKSQKLVKKNRPSVKVSLKTPPKKEEVFNTPTPRKLVKKKVKLGIKRLSMES